MKNRRKRSEIEYPLARNRSLKPSRHIKKASNIEQNENKFLQLLIEQQDVKKSNHSLIAQLEKLKHSGKEGMPSRIGNVLTLKTNINKTNSLYLDLLVKQRLLGELKNTNRINENLINLYQDQKMKLVEENRRLKEELI